MSFSVTDIPSQAGKLAVVTGATGGLGYETALALAGTGAGVILTGRNAQKGADALARVRAAHPTADVTYESLDLGSLAAIAGLCRCQAGRGPSHRHAGQQCRRRVPPARKTTIDGFELQFGTNHLGHFALTARMLPLLRGGRVVTVSSHRAPARCHPLGDLQMERSIVPLPPTASPSSPICYSAFELDRRSRREAAGRPRASPRTRRVALPN